jgi:amino acid transporter/mannitol/fructose-specific phosphotransferase system IIA component (Ntr-type)
MRLLDFKRLDKDLGLSDVYVICVGAMISSGFFLLPGLAAEHAGPGVVVAYLLAGVLIIPAMLSQAELATAMPRAGGAYYFLDRTLGPLVGTIGGVGTWLTMVLKSAFALIGMGAYVALVLDVPVLVTAIVFTVLIALLNMAGARESSGLLRVLVFLLLVTLAFFIVHGLADVFTTESAVDRRQRFSPFLPNGFDGVLEAVGLVFVSFIGLTKVASLAEEVKNPDRNIPLGMTLGLATVTAIYVGGVFVMVAVLGTERLSHSLTPVADAGGELSTWLPRHIGLWLMVGAGIVAFASMANAGILAASRYPLAMARDRLFPDRFAATGPRGTPVAGILLTVGLVVVCLLTLRVESVAKLASALQLVLFGLINVAVIVMRESRIESYDPGFRAPLYPWLQLVGIFVALVLVAEMGWLSVLFTAGVVGACFGWYNYYARHRIERDGAIFHVFERLGRRRFMGLDRELRDMMKEKGLRARDPFDELVARGFVLDYARPVRLDRLLREASERLATRLDAPAPALAEGLGRGIALGEAALAHGVALLHTRLPHLEGSELVLARCGGGVRPDGAAPDLAGPDGVPVRAVFCLVSGESDPGLHLRILAQLAGRVETEDFLETWLTAPHEHELKETVLRDERFRTLVVQPGTPTAGLAGLALRALEMPEGTLVALIGRRGGSIVPRGLTVLENGDRLTIIGEPDSLRKLDQRFSEQPLGPTPAPAAT